MCPVQEEVLQEIQEGQALQELPGQKEGLIGFAGRSVRTFHFRHRRVDVNIHYHALKHEMECSFRRQGDYMDCVERLQSPDKSILSDWLWSFAHPSFNVLPEQDKLIASKRITGRKIVDIIDDQPVYQDVDSIATFPYVFDPVAKTLEIAGLKIWYEVVEQVRSKMVKLRGIFW